VTHGIGSVTDIPELTSSLYSGMICYDSQELALYDLGMQW